MNYITLSQVFAGAAVGQPGETVKLAGPSLTVQTTPGCTATIYGTNMPADSASWQTIGTASGYAGTTLTAAFGYVRVSTDVAGTVAISATTSSGGGGGGGGGTSNTTEATQIQVKVAAQATATAVGAQADAAAPTDTGTASLLSLVKRGLQNWTTLLSRIPALASGRIPVDGSGVIQLGAGAVSATTQRVTLASDGPEVTNSTNSLAKLTSIEAKTPTLGAKAAASSSPVVLPTDVAYDVVLDSAGVLFSPASCSHTYGYDGSGNLTTDTAATGSVVRVKTFAWAGGKITSETKWVAQ